MGLLADFFIASPEAALLYETSVTESTRSAHIENYQPLEYRNLTGLEFGILWSMLAGEEWSVKKHMLTEVRIEDGG